MCSNSIWRLIMPARSCVDSGGSGQSHRPTRRLGRISVWLVNMRASAAGAIAMKVRTIHQVSLIALLGALLASAPQLVWAEDTARPAAFGTIVGVISASGERAI